MVKNISKNKGDKMCLTRYVNPFTDFGFKKIFGASANQDLLIDFLNEVLKLEGKDRIKHIEELNPEQLGYLKEDRGAVFDIYCRTEKGEYCIIEMQKMNQHNFFERCLFYSTFPIRQQIEKGSNPWSKENLKIKVYIVGVLDFIFQHDDKVETEIYFHDEVRHRRFYDSVKMIFLEMPKFNKTIDELETRYDKWLYVLSNLSRLPRMPEALKDAIFEKLFKVATVADYSDSEQITYNFAQNNYIATKDAINFAEDEGREKGRKEGRKEGREEGRKEGRKEGREEGIKEGRINTLSNIAKSLKSKNKSDKEIAELLNITINELKKILK